MPSALVAASGQARKYLLLSTNNLEVITLDLQDKIRADLLCEDRRAHKRLEDVLDLAIGQDLRVTGHTGPRVEQRVSKRRARFGALVVVGAAEPSRMRELEADDEVPVRSVSFPVSGPDDADQFGEVFFVGLVDDKLARIGAPIRSHSHCLAAKDQLGAAFAKPLPSAPHFVRGAAARCAVPSLHGLCGPSVADASPVDGQAVDGLGQRRIRARHNGVVGRQVQPQCPEMRSESIDGPERRYARVAGARGLWLRTAHARLLSYVWASITANAGA